MPERGTAGRGEKEMIFYSRRRDLQAGLKILSAADRHGRSPTGRETHTDAAGRGG